MRLCKACRFAFSVAFPRSGREAARRRSLLSRRYFASSVEGVSFWPKAALAQMQPSPERT
jgi:hypothetical protein